MKTWIFALIFVPFLVFIILLSGCIIKLTPTTTSTTTSTIVSTTIITTSTTATTTTITIPKLDLNESAMTAPTLIKNPRWKRLPIYVYIDSESCQLHEDEIEQSLNIWEVETVVSFKIIGNPDCENCINVTCYTEAETNKTIEEGYIYTKLGEARISAYYPLEYLNVINDAEVYIYRTTKSCSRPVRYMHEFGHALGLAHTNNTADIMHQYVECDMIITDDIKTTLAELYSKKADKYVEYYLS